MAVLDSNENTPGFNSINGHGKDASAEMSENASVLDFWGEVQEASATFEAHQRNQVEVAEPAPAEAVDADLFNTLKQYDSWLDSIKP